MAKTTSKTNKTTNIDLKTQITNKIDEIASLVKKLQVAEKELQELLDKSK